VGFLIATMLLGVALLAPAAIAQTAGPGISPSALDGDVKPAAPKAKPAKPAAKKPPARTGERKAGVHKTVAAHKTAPAHKAAGVQKTDHKTVAKTKAPARKAPAKHVVLGDALLV
jgi:RNA polymerase-binding transcription factor